MNSDLQLAYLGIEVPDPASLNNFFGEIIGLVPGEPADDGSITWRNDDRAHRVIVQPGSANDAAFVGFEAADTDVFAATVGRLRAAGYAVTDGSDVARRRVAQMARVDAPWGVSIEVVTRLAAATTPYSSPLMPGGFLTEGVGFGHAVFATTAFDESLRFVDAIGLVQSDWLEMEIAAGIELEVRFFHCNERHHTLALAKAPFELPQQLHHFMVEAKDRDDVGAAYDRAFGTDLAITNGLGRHDNDGMFSFYVQSPAGFQVEVGHGGRTITDSWDDNRRYDRISAWGHQPVIRQS